VPNRSCGELPKQLQTDHPGAAASLREGLEETLTVTRLGAQSEPAAHLPVNQPDRVYDRGGQDRDRQHQALARRRDDPALDCQSGNFSTRCSDSRHSLPLKVPSPGSPLPCSPGSRSSRMVGSALSYTWLDGSKLPRRPGHPRRQPSRRFRYGRPAGHLRVKLQHSSSHGWRVRRTHQRDPALGPRMLRKRS
jgi:hypothetical protein